MSPGLPGRPGDMKVLVKQTDRPIRRRQPAETGESIQFSSVQFSIPAFIHSDAFWAAWGLANLTDR